MLFNNYAKSSATYIQKYGNIDNIICSNTLAKVNLPEWYKETPSPSRPLIQQVLP